MELYAEKYGDFGPTLATEKLEELDGIKINNPDAEHRGCCSHKGVAVGFNTLCYDAERRGIKPSARINHETLRRLLIKEGLWSRKRRRNIHRQRRERRSCFGQLLQFDGSHHRWFEQRVVRDYSY